MQKELAAERHEVAFSAINEKGRADNRMDQDHLASRCEFPLFQDTYEQDAWARHGGVRDDLFLYGPDGRLRRYLPAAGGDTNLSMEESYEALKQLILKTR